MRDTFVAALLAFVLLGGGAAASTTGSEVCLYDNLKVVASSQRASAIFETLRKLIPSNPVYVKQLPTATSVLATCEALVVPGNQGSFWELEGMAAGSVQRTLLANYVRSGKMLVLLDGSTSGGGNQFFPLIDALLGGPSRCVAVPVSRDFLAYRRHYLPGLDNSLPSPLKVRPGTNVSSMLCPSYKPPALYPIYTGVDPVSKKLVSMAHSWAVGKGSVLWVGSGYAMPNLKGYSELVAQAISSSVKGVRLQTPHPAPTSSPPPLPPPIAAALRAPSSPPLSPVAAALLRPPSPPPSPLLPTPPKAPPSESPYDDTSPPRSPLQPAPTRSLPPPSPFAAALRAPPSPPPSPLLPTPPKAPASKSLSAPPHAIRPPPQPVAPMPSTPPPPDIDPFAPYLGQNVDYPWDYPPPETYPSPPPLGSLGCAMGDFKQPYSCSWARLVKIGATDKDAAIQRCRKECVRFKCNCIAVGETSEHSRAGVKYSYLCYVTPGGKKVRNPMYELNAMHGDDFVNQIAFYMTTYATLATCNE